MPDEIWLAHVIAAKMARLRAGDAFTLEQIRKSYQQLDISKKLLDLPIAHVWHPEPPKG
jgi:hypothetical protein